MHNDCGLWEDRVRKPVNQTSWEVVVAPTDRPKSVRNRYVIKPFGGFLCRRFSFYEFPVNVWAFVELHSQLSL